MKSTSTASYISNYEETKYSLPGAETAWVDALRQKSISHFEKEGFQTSKNEEWKYTRTHLIEDKVFKISQPENLTMESEKIAHLLSEEAHTIVFVDGHYAFSQLLPTFPENAILKNFSEALKEEEKKLEPYLGKIVDYQKHSLGALNTACMSDGFFLEVQPNTIINEPIQCLFITTEANEGKAAHIRNLIVIGEHSYLSVIEQYHSIGGQQYLTNVVTEISMDKCVHFEHYKLQQESEQAIHIAILAARQMKDSQLTGHNISLGGKLTRNDVNVNLDGEGIECALNGLYLAFNQQHVDNHTTVDHKKPHGTSRENYKGIIGGKGRAVFNGKIIVQPDAQKTDARLTNKNLLLSKTAEVDTKPELEIEADDVKCSHGAAVGQLSEESLFYLRARGISESAAKSILTFAFAKEIIDRLPLQSMRDRCKACVEEALHVV